MSVSCRRSIAADSCDRRYFDHYRRVKRYVILYCSAKCGKMRIVCVLFFMVEMYFRE